MKKMCSYYGKKTEVIVKHGIHPLVAKRMKCPKCGRKICVQRL